MSQQHCKSNLQVHHLTYESVGCERFGDLLVVCDDCHDELEVFIRKMIDKGFDRRKVMRRLAPYCIRRLLRIHDLYKQGISINERERQGIPDPEPTK